ncbi:MAG: glycosyltransferase, partial [bacterium]|nr:glycosyltransferase [bacterium]
MSKLNEQVTSSIPPREWSLRIAILQRVLPQYWMGLFQILSGDSACNVRLFIGADLPSSKVRSVSDFGDLDVIRMPTRFFNLGARQLTDHQGLKSVLAAFEPDAILCEGESNVLSYLKALWYRARHPKTALIHWSLGGLPGAPIASPLRRGIKRRLLAMFDTYVVYSSYGRDELIELGCPSNNIHVAVNVSDIGCHLDAARYLMLTKEQARLELGLPMAFTVLYAGALDDDKHLDKLVTALADPTAPQCNLVVLGDGPLRGELETKASELGLRHAFFPGRVSWETMAKYYRAGDVFVLPGRGGMVMSEAMAHGLPVIVHQADGTEFDLVRDGETGYRLDSGSPEAIR